MTNKSPEKQPPAKSGKNVTCNVVLLDGDTFSVTVDKNDIGQVLFDKVCDHLDLLEKEYFGFTFLDDNRNPSHVHYWLNLDKKISKQKKRGPWVFDFALKFYPPDPTHLRESLTRWLVVLQVRRDLLSGKLPCTFTTYALLGSYLVQSDVEDFDREKHGIGFEYIKDKPLAPNQTPELLEKIAELHKQHKGQRPDEAENYFLDNAKKLAMYGVDMHKAQDSDNQPIMLGVCASGLLVYRDKLRINRFVWPKILKLSYKRNHFYIKIRPAEIERNETNIMFKLENHRLAKRLWKTCVEHHAFFRLREADKPTNNPSFPRFGSKFRYSGRTLYQSRQKAAELDRPQPFFERPAVRNTFYEANDRSKSVDELANRNKDYEGYGDDSYDPYGTNKYNKNKYGDEDRRDFKNNEPAYETLNRDGNRYGQGEDGTLQRRPYDTNEDRRDKLASPEDATLERDHKQGYGKTDESIGLAAGEVYGKPETDKEKRKREKEEDKKRRKEAEERKKREEEERKRAAKDKKNKGKGDLPTSEDRTDKLAQNPAMETTFDGSPDGRGLEGGALLHGPADGKGEKNAGYEDQYGHQNGDGYDKDGRYHSPDDKYGDKYGPPAYDAQGNYGQDGKHKGDGSGKDKDGKDKDKKVKKSNSFFGRKKKDKDRHGSDSDSDGAGGKKGGKGRKGDKGNLYGAPGYPYGVGLGVGKGDMTGVVGDEVEIDNRQKFMPIFEPVKETKASLKGGYSDNTMSFFSPDATSTVGRSKVPPPVLPKGNHSIDDSFDRNDYKTEKDGVEELRFEQRVVMSGDEADDRDFDAALAEAIRSVTEFNPDMSVERIECVQQIEDVKDGK